MTYKYEIKYTVISFSYGSVSGCCGDYETIGGAITREIELRLNKGKGETFSIQVNWEKVDV